MSYQEWRRQHSGWSVWPNITFWQIIDHNWLPEEQNELARLWKAWAPE